MSKITLDNLSDNLKEYINGPCVSIKDFGAKGDCKYEDRADCIPNGTDDTISFQNAVDFCILNNKTLVIPPGEYLLTDTITVNGNLTIKGGGMNKTKLIFYLLDKNKNGIEVSGCSDVWSDFSLYCAGYLGKAGIMFGTEQNNVDNQSMRLEKIQCITFRYGISTLMPETMNRMVFDHCQFISNLIAGIYIKSFEGNDFGHSCPLTFFNCICNANGFDPSWMKNFTYQGINILDDVDKLSYQVYIKGSTNLVWYGGQISNHGNNKNTAMVYLDTINGATFDYLDFEDFKSDAVYSENGEPISEVLGLCEGAAFVAFRVRSMNINLRSLHAINSPVLIKLVQCYDVNTINFIKDLSSYFKYSVHATGMCWTQGTNGNEGYIHTHSDIRNFNEEALSLVQSGNKCNLSKSYNNSLLKPKFGNIVEDFNFDYIYKIDINGENPSEGNTYHVNYVGDDINTPDLSKSCYVEKEVYKPYSIIGNIYSLVNNYDPDVKFFVAQYQGEQLTHIDYISTKGDFDLKHDTAVGNTYVKPFSITCMGDVTKIIYGFINLQNYETNLTTCNKLQGFTLDVVYMNGKLINMPHNDQISKIEKMVNELFQSANNGKQLIADAIGSPLSSDDTFAAMGEKIDEMTELFREKIKYIGLTDPVEDLSFKQLIALLDKVKLENPCLNIVLNNTNYTFYNIGETYQLIATVTPPDTTDTIQWLSSDPAIASVDNQGIVTAVANGSCTITAICGDMQATCAISCAIIRPCTALRLNKSSVSFSAIGETYQLVANPTPSNTTDSIIWSTSNSNIATVTNSGKVTAGSTEGSCTITAKCGSKTATCSITMKIAKPCTSIVFSDSEDRFRIGWTYLLKVTTEPWNTTDPVIWTISDPSLITATPLGYNNTDLEIVVNSDYGSCVITAKCGSKSVSRTITCED